MDFLDYLFESPDTAYTYSQQENTEPLPEELKQWFRLLILLKGVPLSYLIPHPKLLLPESIRFFDLDTNWLKALAAGAFSIGQYSYETEAEDKYRDFRKTQLQDISGILLRSEIVQHYPGLYFKGYPQKGIKNVLPAVKPLEILRDENLTSDIRLVLFKGLVKTVALFSPPESLELCLPNEKWENEHGVIQSEKITPQALKASSSSMVKAILSEGHYVLFNRKTS